MRIIIGGSADDAMPWEDFVRLLREFPTTSLLEHYGDKRVASILSDYLTPKTDYEQKYAEAKRRVSKKTDYTEDNIQIGTQNYKREPLQIVSREPEHSQNISTRTKTPMTSLFGKRRFCPFSRGSVPPIYCRAS